MSGWNNAWAVNSFMKNQKVYSIFCWGYILKYQNVHLKFTFTSNTFYWIKMKNMTWVSDLLMMFLTYRLMIWTLLGLEFIHYRIRYQIYWSFWLHFVRSILLLLSFVSAWISNTKRHIQYKNVACVSGDQTFLQI